MSFGSYEPRAAEVGSQPISPEQVQQLSAQVQELTGRISDARLQRHQYSKRLRQAQRWAQYLRASRGLRQGTRTLFGSWIGGALIIGTSTGAMLFVITFSWIAAIIGFLLGITAATVVFSVPGDDALDGHLEGSSRERAALESEIHVIEEQLATLGTALVTATELYHRANQALRDRQLRESQQYRLEQLLRRDWKSLRSVPFENYLEEVFRELGYNVETTKLSGDQGADLIVSKGGRRIAIQVKGYFNSVSNSAVQEAYTARGYYGCEGCAVITNSRFTSGAQDVANRIGCVLIDENSLPPLILGQIDLYQLCLSATNSALQPR